MSAEHDRVAVVGEREQHFWTFVRIGRHARRLPLRRRRRRGRIAQHQQHAFGIAELASRQTARSRFTGWMMAIFAGSALLLAMIGIYGVMSYAVVRRTQEIGIRMALGATTSDVKRQIVGQTLWLTTIGVLVGAAASWALARGMEGLLFEVSASDPKTFLGMAAVLTVVATIAGYLPARRASGIDPMIALRSE